MRLIFYIFLLMVGTLFAKEGIATVTRIEGSVTALQPKEMARELIQGSLIYVQDKISVAENSRVQLEFTDGTLLGLQENTVFLIHAYQYSSGQGKNLSELVEGGFRLLSGSIKPDPKRYNVKTSIATIGLRGTRVEGTLQEDVLYVSCDQGQVEITNKGGTVVIGEGMEQYAIVTSYARRPQIFIAPPPPVIRPMPMVPRY